MWLQQQSVHVGWVCLGFLGFCVMVFFITPVLQVHHLYPEVYNNFLGVQQFCLSTKIQELVLPIRPDSLLAITRECMNMGHLETYSFFGLFLSLISLHVLCQKIITTLTQISSKTNNGS